jgi:hypothetical protein
MRTMNEALRSMLSWNLSTALWVHWLRGGQAQDPPLRPAHTMPRSGALIRSIQCDLINDHHRNLGATFVAARNAMH